MDRGFDPVAPVIHDWTYEPLVYDLLAPAGSVFKYHAQTQGGERDCHPASAMITRCFGGLADNGCRRCCAAVPALRSCIRTRCWPSGLHCW